MEVVVIVLGTVVVRDVVVLSRVVDAVLVVEVVETVVLVVGEGAFSAVVVADVVLLVAVEVLSLVISTDEVVLPSDAVVCSGEAVEGSVVVLVATVVGLTPFVVSGQVKPGMQGNSVVGQCPPRQVFFVASRFLRAKLTMQQLGSHVERQYPQLSWSSQKHLLLHCRSSSIA